MPTTSQLQELDKLNRIIKQKSLDYKVNKEYGQETLKEFYKPILDIKTKEQEVIKEQHKEELNKIQNMTEELKKQQLIVPLIKSLKDYPGVVAVIRGESDGSDLTGKEQYILKQLQDIDDRTLRTLIDYYNTDTESLPSRSPVDLPKYTRIPQYLESDKLGQWLIDNDLPSVRSAKLLLKEQKKLKKE